MILSVHSAVVITVSQVLFALVLLASILLIDIPRGRSNLVEDDRKLLIGDIVFLFILEAVGCFTAFGHGEDTAKHDHIEADDVEQVEDADKGPVEQGS